MEENGIFKSSMFGFDKQSVLRYVDEMIEKSKEEEQKLKKRCDELCEELDTLKKSISEKDMKISELENKVSESATESEAKVKTAEEHEGRVRELEDRIAALTKENEDRMSSVVRENGELRSRIDLAEERGRKYEQASAKIGDVMFEAQQKGEEIINEAHKKAEEVAKSSVDSIYEINDKLNSFKSDMQKLRGFTEDTLANFDGKMNEIDLALKRAEGYLYINAGKTLGDDTAEEPVNPVSEGYQETVENIQSEHSEQPPEAPPTWTEKEPVDFFQFPYQG